MSLNRIRTGVSLTVVCLCAAAMFGAQTPAPQATPEAVQNPETAPDPQDPRYKLAVDVQLVNFTATVLDDAGRYVNGLNQGDFQVFEEGQEQKISFFSHDLKVPISVGVLVDASGSMKHKLQQALQTVREIASALSRDDEMFLITFNSEVTMRQRFTSNPQEIQKVLREVRAGGETAAYDAIELATREMRGARNAKKILILVTDGFDTKSRINAVQAEELLKKSELLVYAIGIDDDENDPLVQRRTRYHIYHYMLGRLTGVSGGRAFRLFTGRNYALNSLAQVLIEELHQQYTIGYYPTLNGDPAAWRAVEVKLRKPGPQIRHRAGYYLAQGAVTAPEKPQR